MPTRSLPGHSSHTAELGAAPDRGRTFAFQELLVTWRPRLLSLGIRPRRLQPESVLQQPAELPDCFIDHGVRSAGEI